MSKYYSVPRRRNLYDPASADPFEVSRTKIDMYLSCPRCFYMDRRLGVGQPPGFPFTLNSAVDALLKQEFDTHRLQGTKHPLQEKYGLDAQPVPHADLDKWRHNFTGVRFHHEPTNLVIFGAIDDLWQNSRGEYHVVDYKATAKRKQITALDEEWHEGYKRQMEVYQWLLRRNGHPVSDRGYFVYCNGQADREAFDGQLEFDVTIIPHDGDDKWVEPTIKEIHQCLNGETAPEATGDCDYCAYRDAANSVLDR